MEFFRGEPEEMYGKDMAKMLKGGDPRMLLVVTSHPIGLLFQVGCLFPRVIFQVPRVSFSGVYDIFIAAKEVGDLCANSGSSQKVRWEQANCQTDSAASYIFVRKKSHIVYCGFRYANIR